jgi:hypothetical protein
MLRENMVSTYEVWDATSLTRGSLIEITGYSNENEYEFEKETFLIQSHEWDKMTVINFAGKTFEIWLFELAQDETDTGLLINMVHPKPYKLPF